MKNTWLSADLHLKHKNILKFQPNRKFDSLDEHDEAIIENWNKIVKPKDDLWFLGDFAFASQVVALEYLKRLNGRIHFIIGNHDHKVVKNINFQRLLSFLGDFTTIRGFHKLPITLCHYPFLSWPHSGRGSYHFHGHTHGYIDNTGTNRIDVGIDTHPNLRPWNIDELILPSNSQ